MKDSISTQLEPITKPLSKFLWRFHLIFFSIFVIGGVAVAIFMFTSLLGTDVDPTPSARTNFDSATMKEIQNFESPDSSNTALYLPNGRTNPFVE